MTAMAVRVLSAVAAPLLGAGLLLGTGQAHADADGYLAALQQHIPNVYQRYGSQALLNEGTKVCNWAAQGIPNIGTSTGDSPSASGSIMDRIMFDLPMSSDAAMWVQELAEDKLGC